jgi:hypothetical protein
MNMSGVRLRMGRDTIVLAIQDTLGSIESMTQFNFPDIRSRPTFRVGIFTRSLWEPLTGSNSDSQKDSLSLALANKRTKQAGFTVYDHEEGSLALGPYIPGKVCLSRGTFIVSFPLVQLLLLN